MRTRSGFESAALSERFSGRDALLRRVAGDAPEAWVREVAEHTARQSEIFVELINKCPFGIYLVDDALTIVAMNERSQEGAFRNVRPVIGRSFEEAMRILWPVTVAEEIVGHFRHTLETGEPYRSNAFVEPRADVDHVEGYEWELHSARLPGGGRGVICYYFDSTELRDAQRALVEAARRQRLLIDELNHRVKNMLSVVQSLARQTIGRSPDPAAAQLAFEGRLGALARAHDTLTRVHWEKAELAEVVAGAFDSCGVADRVRIGGPTIWLDSRIAVTVAMALHELSTNAIKYGALSTESGAVDFTWRVEKGAQRLLLEWRERGGPAVTPPTRRGFGTRMLERALAGDLKAQVRLDFAPEGLVCTIEATAPALFDESAVPGDGIA
ncbi:histidine kinase [Sphingomonas sp. ABOLD]|uniref:histidine kinase n=1 Tax=Sphingomonas trueperi TaxID=53317 RepID=A0A7X5Y1E3_9SPHN|nr:MULTISPECIES: PAS domain-containing sensor histidine kinase [Sphingomonas]NJB98000.1 two-component sensor histidine kinase [Sphingomonas trueperi]RSV43067.1 histidine kinase [Sphingomonas sp. ABOLD]